MKLPRGVSGDLLVRALQEAGYLIVRQLGRSADWIFGDGVVSEDRDDEVAAGMVLGGRGLLCQEPV